MYLLDIFERLKEKKNYKCSTGTADIVHEIYEKSAKDESGRIPIIIKPDIPEKKQKKLTNYLTES